MYTGPGQLGARTAYKQVENILRNWSNPLSKRRMKSLQGAQNRKRWAPRHAGTG